MDKQDLRILSSIYNVDIDKDATCQACEEMLATYVDAELQGDLVNERYQEVHQHLQECGECQMFHEELLLLRTQEIEGRLLEPSRSPEIDLSFLPDPQLSTRLWQVAQESGKEVLRLFADVRIRLAEKQAQFVQLNAPLQPQWVAIPAVRATDAPKAHQMLQIPAGEGALEFQLELGYATETNATVGVRLRDANTNIPATRIRATLRDEQSRILASELTDKDGYVSFTDMMPGDYLLEVKHQGGIWQLPLVIES